MVLSVLPRKLIMLFLLALFIGSLAFQIRNLTATSLWHDEAFSALLIQYEDYGEMLHRIGLDVHPPLYYMVLRVWAGMFGDSLFSLRFFSLFFGLLSMFATFLVAKEIFKKRDLAFLCALVLGMSSFQIQYNLEARMYTLGTFFVLLATFFFIQSLKTHIPSLRFYFFIGAYALCAAAALYTHYYTFFAFAAHMLFTIYWLRFQLKKLLFVGIGFAASGILFLPWLPIFLRQLSQVQESFWIPPINKWSIPTTISKMATGNGFDPNQAALLIIFINIFTIGAFLFTLSRYSRRERWILFFLVLLPFAGILLLSLKTSLYLDRYFIFYLPFFIITITAAIFAIPQKQVRFIALFLLILGSAASFPIHWRAWDLGEKPGMQATSSYILSSAAPDDIVLVNSSFVFFTFRYYNENRLPYLLYAPEKLSHFSGTALLNESDMIRSLEDVGKTSDSIWTIDTTGFGNLQPIVPASWQKQEEKDFPDAYAHRGSIIVRKYLIGI